MWPETAAPAGERAFRVFRVMRSREPARRAGERRAEPELFPKPLCRKGASDPEPAGEGIERFRHNVSAIYEVFRGKAEGKFGRGAS